MTEIIPGLFIGSWHDARDASEDFLRLTVALDSEFIGAGHFKLVDGPGNPQSEFDAAVSAVVAAAPSAEKKVLVHCVSGRSRSAAVIVAALSRMLGLASCQAYDLLISKHDETRIHPSLAPLLLNQSILPFPIPRIRIVTATNANFAPLADICAASIRKYAAKVDVDFVRETIPDGYTRHPSWFKVPLIARHLPHVDYVLWMDADSMIVGDADIRALIKDATLNIAKDENGINCGVMAWKNCPQAFEALNRIDGDYSDHPWFEQFALMKFVNELDVHIQPKQVFNAYPDDRCAETLIFHVPAWAKDDRLAAMRVAAKEIGL